MNAIGVVGSPRRNGNTEIITKHTLQSIAEEGLETELITLSGMDIRPCDGCRFCKEEKNERCHIDDDLMPIYEKLKAADAIILASPVYYGSATSLIKSLMDRVGYIGGQRGVFAGKVGGPLVVARRAGQNFTHAQLLFWFHILGFYMPGSTYWNISFGREKGEVNDDEEGLQTAWNFGKNIAHLVKKLKA
ncbi:MAG TPA: flavodoxin family protein [Dehalococcoidia bacterium]|nr:flavodoxin family protein [Dehalococcoidia bacterium]